MAVKETTDALIGSACSSDVALALELLATHPELASETVAAACVTGTVNVVERWLADGADVSAGLPPFGWQAISYACFSRLLRAAPELVPGIRAVVAALLRAGASPDAPFDHEGWLQVPLYGAAGIAADPTLTQLLLDHGADPNDGSEPHTIGEALYHACEFPDPACARLLIDAGTDQDGVDYCLGRALNFPNAEMVAMFCAHGARPGASHLDQAVWRRRPVSTVEALLESGAPLDTPNESGHTPLQIAFRWGDTGIAAVLRDRGADEARVKDEDRALGAYLTRGGARPSVDPADLDEMLILAVQQDDLLAVRRLLDLGVSVDGQPNGFGQPLGEACWRGLPRIARELVDRGARLTFGDGRSAVGSARHGSRNCHHPEGGPTMRTVQEIPTEPYAELLRILADAGAADR